MEKNIIAVDFDGTLCEGRRVIKNVGYAERRSIIIQIGGDLDIMKGEQRK